MAISNAAATRIVALSLILGLSVAGGRNADGTSPPAWTNFTSTSEHLSVLMPGRPKESEQHNKSFVGDIKTIMHTAKDGLDTYAIDYTTLPGFAVSFSGADGIYEHAKNAVLKDTFSKALTYTDVTLNGIKGKKLTYDTPTKPGHPEMRGEARFFLVGHDLYTVDAVVEMKGADEKLEHFFSSLDISG